LISKNSARVRLPRRRRDDEEGPWGDRPEPAIPQQWVAAQAPDLDPVIAAAAQPVDPAAEVEMEAAWRAYGEVVDVLSAITHAARLAERGVCPDTQISNIDLLAADLEAAWARWEAAHQRVIGLGVDAEA
jgi:hypothetical protein